MTFEEPIVFPTLLDDIQQVSCHNNFLIELGNNERELMGNKAISLETGDPKLETTEQTTDQCVETVTCSKLVIAKVAQYVYPPILGVSPLAKVVHYMHSTFFKPPWIEEGSRARTLNQTLVGR